MKKIENSFAVSGIIGKDAEIRQFTNTSVARFAIAVHRGDKSSDAHASAFLSAEAWRKNSNLLEFELLKKGTMITIEGFFKPEEWFDENSGAKRNRIVMVATKFYATPEIEDKNTEKEVK